MLKLVKSHSKFILLFLSFSMMKTCLAQAQSSLSTIMCHNKEITITINSACAIPAGSGYANAKSGLIKNSSYIKIVKNGIEIFNKKVNCIGVIIDSYKLFYNYYMDKDSYNESSFVFAATAYDAGLQYREFNSINLDKFEKTKGSPLNQLLDKYGAGINIRDFVEEKNTDIKCTGF